MGKGGGSAYFEDFEVGAAEHAQNGGEHSCGLLEGGWIFGQSVITYEYSEINTAKLLATKFRCSGCGST